MLANVRARYVGERGFQQVATNGAPPLSTAEGSISQETPKPEAATDPLPYLPPLEGNNALPPNKGHPVCDELPRSPEH